MKVLVTGAAGFLGSHLVATLHESGCEVRAATRDPQRSIPLAEKAVLPVAGELVDWSAVVRGVDAVVHLAARAHRPPAAQETERDLYRQANVENTLNLAQTAAGAGAKHFVFLSSIAVNGRTSDGRPPLCESDPPSPITVYAQTKLEAETALAGLSRNAGFRLTVIRTPLIYGRGARGSLAQLVRALELGLPLPLASVRNRHAFAATGNVASFILHRLRNGTDNGTFIVADNEHISTPEFVRLLASALGVSARLFALPQALLSASLKLSGRAHVAESLIGSLEVDTGKARATGWNPTPMAEAMRAAFR